MEHEDKVGLRAVLNLVKDSQTCLDNAIQELRVRKLGRFGWAMGSIGAARSAVKFAHAMIEGFIRLGDEPKQVGGGVTDLCSKGHDRAVCGRNANGQCSQCVRERARAWAVANPDRRKQQHARWNARPEVKKKRAAYSAQPDQRKKTLTRSRTRKGVLAATAEKRHGACPLCPFVGPLVLDHKHPVGPARGWLCSPCNCGIGWLEKTDWRARAEAYLKGSHEKPSD